MTNRDAEYAASNGRMDERDYDEIAAAGDYSFEQHRANVVALGDGEKPDRWTALWRHTQAARARNRDNAGQVREWEQERVQVLAGCMGALCSECRMGVKDCEDYQDFLDSEGYGAQQFTTAQGLEIAGAFTPRCDH